MPDLHPIPADLLPGKPRSNRRALKWRRQIHLVCGFCGLVFPVPAIAFSRLCPECGSGNVE